MHPAKRLLSAAGLTSYRPRHLCGAARLVLVCGAAVAGLLSVPAVSFAASPLAFSSPVSVSPGAPYENEEQINAVSCPSTSLCVELDDGGGVVSTSDPTAATPVWSQHFDIDSSILTTNALSCPTTSLCVAVDNDGNVMISTDPGAAQPTWSLPGVDRRGRDLYIGLVPDARLVCCGRQRRGCGGNHRPDRRPRQTGVRRPHRRIEFAGRGFVCFDRSLRRGVDNDGNAMITTDPTAATPSGAPQRY